MDDATKAAMQKAADAVFKVNPGLKAATITKCGQAFDRNTAEGENNFSMYCRAKGYTEDDYVLLKPTANPQK